ncbi:hypothetical protein TUM4438_17100 [Shewanella sairae]|uniref:Tetratricopeptide repeat protein n=1 Tax=Shewanella sairae TaxID=190310 RepID=A0ABQ4PBG7_9GAMM|nr:putative 2OG-Fe(II) oxygenase [Shewanella sairae]MCL1128145.1 putative 2OG-Fe(II) oxygenase [Shewanella sairae]GIU44875.1 hypothetical protein TUM4438_17100 [Shewanella sairae]
MDRIRVNKNLTGGIELYRKGLYQDSLTLLYSIHNIAPKEPNALFFIALNHRYLKDVTASIFYFEKLISLHKLPGYFCAYANMLISFGLELRAIPLLRQSISIDPFHFDSYYNLGRAEQNLELYSEACNAYVKARKLNPLHIGCCIGYSQSLSKCNQVEQAIACCESFLKETSTSFEVLYTLAGFYEHLDLLDSALTTTCMCLKLVPESRESRLRYAILLHKLGSDEEAIAVFKELLATFPYDLKVHHELFKILWLKAEAEPFKYYLEFSRQDPSNPLVLDLVKKLIKNDELELALEKIKIYIYEKKATSEALIIKAHLERELGFFRLSLETLESLSVESKDTECALYEKAITYLCLQQFLEAICLARRMISLYPKNQAGKALLSSCLKVAGHEVEYRQLNDYDNLVKYIPVFEDEKDHFNSQLKSSLERLHKTNNAPLDQSLRYGTQTEGRLFNKGVTTVDELEKRVALVISDFLEGLSQHHFTEYSGSFKITDSWSVILRSKGYHKNHYHSEGMYSACYYVDVPFAVEKEGQGWLKLGQPELSRWIKLDADFYLKPLTGWLVIFPSYLWHGTTPLLESSERISVAFDIQVL